MQVKVKGTTFRIGLCVDRTPSLAIYRPGVVITATWRGVLVWHHGRFRVNWLWRPLKRKATA